MCPKHIPGPTNIIYTYLTQQLMHDTHMTLKKWLGLCVGHYYKASEGGFRSVVPNFGVGT